MARTKRQLQYFTFARGWHTASTEIAFPQDAVSNIVNMDIQRDGSIKRRAGLDAIGTGTVVSADSSSEVATFTWDNVGGTPGLSYNVVQVGSTLMIYSADDTAPLVGTVDLSLYETSERSVSDYPVQCASGSGNLFVANQAMETIYIDGDLSVTQITIKVRDFDGVDDGLENTERPDELSDEHFYNLLNQGWPLESNLLNESRNANTLNDVFQGNPIEDTKLRLDVYPSNADIFYYGKVGAADSAAAIGAYRPYVLETNVFGNTLAPKGHFIVEEFAKNRSAVNEELTLPTVSTTARPSAIGFFNGRLFLSGVPNSNLTDWSTRIYFSQILTDMRKVNNFYQEQDPTAEEFNDLLATDGGVIVIPEMGRAVAMRATDFGILLFAENGVWELRGEADGVFSPTGYSVRKITNIGTTAPSSIVEVSGTYLYWADEGIIALQQDDVSLTINATNITENTIDNKYRDITTTSKLHVVGTYDQHTNRVVWLYNDVYHYDYTKFSGVFHDDVDGNYKNRALILDVAMQCFYRYAFEMPIESEHVIGAVSSRSVSVSYDSEPVVADGVTVTADAVDVTVQAAAISAAPVPGMRYILRDGTAVRLATMTNESFTDIGTATGAVIESAIIVGKSPITQKNGNYVYTYAKEQQFSFDYVAPTEAGPITDLTDFEDPTPPEEVPSVGDEETPVTFNPGGEDEETGTFVPPGYTLPEDCKDCSPDATWDENFWWEAIGPPASLGAEGPTYRTAGQAAHDQLVADLYSTYDEVVITGDGYFSDPPANSTWVHKSLTAYLYNEEGEVIATSSGGATVRKRGCSVTYNATYCELTESPIYCGDDWIPDGVVEYTFVDGAFKASECDPDATNTDPRTYLEVSDGTNLGAFVATSYGGFMYVPLDSGTGEPKTGGTVSYYTGSGLLEATHSYSLERVTNDAANSADITWG